jgi:hypothetical protein
MSSLFTALLAVTFLSRSKPVRRFMLHGWPLGFTLPFKKNIYVSVRCGTKNVSSTTWRNCAPLVLNYWNGVNQTVTMSLRRSVLRPFLASSDTYSVISNY